MFSSDNSLILIKKNSSGTFIISEAVRVILFISSDFCSLVNFPLSIVIKGISNSSVFYYFNNYNIHLLFYNIITFIFKKMNILNMLILYITFYLKFFNSFKLISLSFIYTNFSFSLKNSFTNFVFSFW